MRDVLQRQPTGNGMGYIRGTRPKLKKKYYSLTDLSELVKAPIETLLDAACTGALQVFVRVPAGVRVFSVHAHAVDIDDADRFLEKVIRRIPAPDESESAPIVMPPLDPQESLPLDMAAFSIEGLRLTSADCHKVREKSISRQYLFSSGVKITTSMIENLAPTRGHIAFFDRRTLCEEGWLFACFPRRQPISFYEGIGYSGPQAIDISIGDLFATDMDIEGYLDTLDIHVLLSDLFKDGEVIEKLPEYFSEKLIHLIKLNRELWENVSPTDVDLLRNRRDEAEERLSKDTILFEKKRPSSDALQAALDFTTPIYAWRRVMKEEPRIVSIHITPELLALMAAAKWTWGATRVKMDDVSTHPRFEDVEALLRDLDVKGKNNAKYGVALIRPEAADRGKPTPKEDPIWGPLIGLKPKITKFE